MTTASLDSDAGNQNHDISNDYDMVDESVTLPIRSRTPHMEVTPRVELHPLASTDSFLVSIHPPSQPKDHISHVPCDIVLVIDVSGSMADQAPLPDAENEEESEASNLTVLDLVRHACRTIVSTLTENDRLALITFSQDAKVVHKLSYMTDKAKADVLAKIEGLKDEGATNLWAGIKTGLQQFEKYEPNGNVQGLYVLTDGQPNYMCPPQGYIPKLKPLLRDLSQKNNSTPSIQTFGFGYSIRSDLMLSIAKAGNGNYAFIPEVGMIGTVFVHAVANLYATYATNAVLELTMPAFAGATLSHTSGLPVQAPSSNRLLINLGSLQYGQSRDLIVHCSACGTARYQTVNARVTFTPHGKLSEDVVGAAHSLKQKTTLPQSVLDYHVSRDNICKLFNTLYPIDPSKEQHTTAATKVVDASVGNFHSLARHISSLPGHDTDPNLSSILSDLVGSPLNLLTPEMGQIYQALQTKPQTKDSRIFKSYWEKWGCHYLSSLWCAHMRQTCNSFKDPGPLRYGVDSPLFKRCRDELDAAFDNLPAPTGTYINHRYGSVPVGPSGASRGFGVFPATARCKVNSSINMKRFNRAETTCMLGTCSVRMADGRISTVQDLRVRDVIHSPLAGVSQKIAGIVRAVGATGQEICRVGPDLWVTPWHPIFDPASATWVFPRTIAEETRLLRDGEDVFSILLDPSDDVDVHAVEVGGVACVTLGHGLLSPSPLDVRAHPFFGDYRIIRQSLMGLSIDQHGRWLCGGLVKDNWTGIACGVLGASFGTSDLAAWNGDGEGDLAVVDENCRHYMARL